MKTATATDIGGHFKDYLAISHEEPVIIMKNRRPVAILMNIHEDREELERLILAHTPRFQALTKDAENRILALGGMEHDEFWDSVSNTGEAVCAESPPKYEAKRKHKAVKAANRK
jgi:hypothetical protein